ncbi:MAG: hypothetical protein KDC18_00890 [Alphaproteobacteria bacterium]|nr:hypothetical protein [Alphaproteobacteria bacterium]MCB9931495.1 hypothetical protein [Alphaproteobacteria bacterium]
MSYKRIGGTLAAVLAVAGAAFAIYATAPEPICNALEGIGYRPIVPACGLDREQRKQMQALDRQVQAVIRERNAKPATPPRVSRVIQSARDAVDRMTAAALPVEVDALKRIAAGETDAGLQELEALAANKPAQWLRLAHLAYALRSDKALAAYEAAAKRHPLAAWDALALSRAYVHTGQVDAARKILADALAVQPEDAAEDRAVVATALGEVDLLRRDLPAATQRFRTALAARQDLADAAGDDPARQEELARAHVRLGGALRTQGDAAAALAEDRTALVLRQRLADAAPGDNRRQYDLSVSLERVGDGLRIQGDSANALTRYRKSLAIRARLATAAPDRGDWQRDLAVSQEKIGDALSELDDQVEALVAYRASLKIRERLVAANPHSVALLRDLSVSQDRIGDMLFITDELDRALAAYGASLAIRKRLTAMMPHNPLLQRDMAVSYEKVANILKAKGDIAGAIERNKAGLAIVQQLLAADPTNPMWHRHIAITLVKLAQLKGSGVSWSMAAAKWQDLADHGLLLPTHEPAFEGIKALAAAER